MGHVQACPRGNVGERAEELRRDIETAQRHALPEVGQRLWAAVAAGHVTEPEAETLGALLARRTEPSQPRTAARLPGPRPARPRPLESVQRRRRWAAAGYLPPRLACAFTCGETAALAVIAAEVAKRGSCDLCHGAVAALAGVSVSTVKRAVKAARVLGLVSVRERRVSRYRSETNIITITSSAWSSWLRLRAGQGGVQTRTATTTSDNHKSRQRAGNRVLGAIERVGRPGHGSPPAGRVRDSG